MCKDIKQRDALKRDFRRWVNMALLHKNISKKELAENMGASFPRVSEAINGTGECNKYIKQIIMVLGNERDLQRFKELYS